MKTKQLSKKMVLNKRTVSSLNHEEIKSLKGGLPPVSYDPDNCYEPDPTDSPIPPSRCRGCATAS